MRGNARVRYRVCNIGLGAQLHAGMGMRHDGWAERVNNEQCGGECFNEKETGGTSLLRNPMPNTSGGTKPRVSRPGGAIRKPGTVESV